MEQHGRVLAGPVLRGAGTVALLVFTAAVVLTVGGAGVLGTLGSILGGGGGDPGAERVELDDARRSARFAAIVADARTPQRDLSGRGTERRRAPAGGRTPRGRAPAPQGPGAPAPTPPAGPGPAPGVPPADPPAPPADRPVVDAIDRAVDQVAEQAPPAARPLLEPIQQLVDRLASECAALPVCP